MEPVGFTKRFGALHAWRDKAYVHVVFFRAAGRLVEDQARPGSPVAVTGADLQGAIDSLIAGESAPADQWPSLGCNIKWHPER